VAAKDDRGWSVRGWWSGRNWAAVARRWPVFLIVVLLLVGFLVLSGGRVFLRPEDQGLQPEPTIKVRDEATGEIKEMGLETYIMGVVAGEMDPHWPVEALGAQAIIARTFTLKKVFEGGGFERFIASTDETKLQAYAPENITPNVREAVRRTRGVVATHMGRVIRTWFHSCSGGQTSTPEEGLNFDAEPTPYIKSVKDPFPCGDKDTWQATFSSEEIAAAARPFGLHIEQVRSMEIVARGPSGRVVTLSINGRRVNAADFRVQLDPRRMRSTLLTELKVRDGQVFMAGRGFGHGVGMSQFGAKALAEQGKTAAEIINYYFANIKLEKRW